jgi:hypothetical protein
VRGLFLGMGEGQNNEVKPAPGKRMDFIRSKCCKWRCIIRWAIYPSRNPATNSFEEAYFFPISLIIIARFFFAFWVSGWSGP